MPFCDLRNRQFHIQVLEGASDLRVPFEGRPFPCLVWDAQGKWGADQQVELVASLIAAGCRYFVCGGLRCEGWEDTADAAFEGLGLGGDDYDTQFVMTTSHPSEPVDDVAFFFVMNTNFAGHNFTEYLVVLAGSEPSVEVLLRDSVASLAARQVPGPGQRP
jgi:hypothetical protein